MALVRYRKTGTLGKSRPSLSDSEWEALWRLTGRPGPKVLDLGELDAALRRLKYGTGLVEVLQVLAGGPLQTRRQERAAFEEAWEAALGAVTDGEWQALLRADCGGAPLLKAAFREGQPVQGTAETVARALQLSQEHASFAALAAQVAGDAHALDVTTLAGKVFRAAAADLDLGTPEQDGVSRTALCANLLGPTWLEATAGHVLALPYREVVRLERVLARGGRLWVVENPSIFESLHAAFPQASLLCTQGQPSSALVALLEKIVPGTTVHLSCDLDLGGLRIASRLLRSVRVDWSLWRMDVGTYELALPRGALPLKGKLPGDQSYFPELAAAMQATGSGIHQENLLPELLQDLQDAGEIPLEPGFRPLKKK
ncbi:MAG: DUF2399 domain-containing protein [Deinococcus sp.]|nr:DUF2399 domain-containing protein [Deinococcus sp.]